MPLVDADVATFRAILDVIPARRMLRPDELGTAVRFLLDPSARYMTATTMVMDGGFTSQ